VEEALLNVELREEYAEYAKLCSCGLETVEGIIKNLQRMDDNNLYSSISTRIKSFESVIEKCERKGYPLTIEGIKEKVHDVAGVRIITPFEDDIYVIADTLKQRPFLKIDPKHIDDYVKKPKPSGYRGYHMTVEVIDYIDNQSQSIPVEIQIKTPSMNAWAEIEHIIRYKSKIVDTPEEIELFAKTSKYMRDFDKQVMAIRDRKRKSNSSSKANRLN